nr:hypothetical protein [Pyrinomonadaceae bacterium]
RSKLVGITKTVLYFVLKRERRLLPKKIEMKGLVKIKFISLMFFLVITAIFANAQENAKANEQKDYGKLRERFNIFLDFQKQKNYEQLYEMLAQEQRKASTKENFIEIYQNSDKTNDDQLNAFIIKKIGVLGLSNFGIVEGCGQYIENKKKKSYDSKVEVVFENGDWYFRSLIGVNTSFNSKAKKCSFAN